MPTTRAHLFCDTQPTTSLALLSTQLIIPPMIPGAALLSVNLGHVLKGIVDICM